MLIAFKFICAFHIFVCFYLIIVMPILFIRGENEIKTSQQGENSQNEEGLAKLGGGRRVRGVLGAPATPNLDMGWWAHMHRFHTPGCVTCGTQRTINVGARLVSHMEPFPLFNVAEGLRASLREALDSPKYIGYGLFGHNNKTFLEIPLSHRRC
jgi:hypothetical protein